MRTLRPLGMTSATPTLAEVLLAMESARVASRERIMAHGLRFLAWLMALVPASNAQIASLPFQDCSTPSSITFQNRINISTIYAQITDTVSQGHFLNLTLLGESGSVVQDRGNVTNLLSTVFAPTSVLTFVLNSQSQYAFCSTLRPPSPLPPVQNISNNYCPLSPGPLAFAVGTPLTRSYELMTLNTHIRVVDTSTPAQELACVQLAATPLQPGFAGSVYGHAAIVFWVSVALAIGYWVVVGAGRLAAAWKRGRQRVHNNIWSHVQGAGFVLASAISGERFASSPALMRFGTPSMRDVVFHTQWCTLLGMVAVQWPRFAYPYFAQTAWATLLYNVSFTQGSDSISKHWNPLHTDAFDPPSGFADQLVDPSSPLFMNTSIPNTLLTFPPGTATGIPALAAAVGVRPQDVFNNAVSLFLLILGGTVILSIFICVIDWSLGSLVRATERRNDGASGTKTPPWTAGGNKEFGESPEPVGGDDELGAGNVRFLHRPTSRTLQNLPTRRGWLSHRLGQSSFHGSVLHGNLIRILILFHLPVTIFSCYQFSSGKSHSSLTAVILAAIAFAIFSISIPAWLVLRLTTTPTSKLYDETRTLLSLGPLYNHYGHGSQLFACLFFASNIAYSVALGSGQQSGTAQSIIILVVEVVSALTTSVWLPWGRGATMGGISFMMCVARIITAVLLVILSPIVAVGDAAGGWIAYAILVIQGLVYLAFLLMLIFKISEGFVRLVWDVSFDRSKHTVDTGLIGAIGLAGCCGSRRKKTSGRAHSRQSRPGSDSTTQNMLPPVMNAAASHSRTTVSGPPSVLRPEQLNQPYREESDDEGGYILGAWHYEDEQPSAPPSPVAPKTGFSRVAGGRANIDSPYTMAAGPSTAFGTNTTNTSRGQAASPVPSASGSNLPPGAMAPGYVPHARRKSQSAIIEESAAALSGPAGISSAKGLTPAPGATRPSELAYDDSLQGSSVSPKRRNWFNLFTSSSDEDGPTGSRWSHRGRAQSEADAVPMLPDEPASPEGTSGGRTFVVIRDRKPSPLSQAQVPSGEGPEEKITSFNVVRPNRTHEVSAHSAGGPSSPPPASPPAIPRRSPHRTRDATF